MSSNASIPSLKVTIAFMKAYKAMRGPRDTIPSSLFACRGGSLGQTAVDLAVQAEDGESGLANLEEFSLFNDVNGARFGDVVEKKSKWPFNGHIDGDSVVTDHTLDYVKMDTGWAKANGPSEFDDEDPYVSDDDGDHFEVRISPAAFRALATGCMPDNADTLHPVLPGTMALRPATPQDRIVDMSKEVTNCDNTMPCYYRHPLRGGLQKEQDNFDVLSPLPISSCRPCGSPSPSRGSPLLLPSCMTAATVTEHDLLQAYCECWRAIETCQVANKDAQAANTALARCLAIIEHHMELCRKAELARECQEAKDHYREQCRLEGYKKRRAKREAHKFRKVHCQHRRMVLDVGKNMRSLRTVVGEASAQLARGRELQAVLAQRLQDGETRLERLYRDYSAANVAVLSVPGKTVQQE
ncbi:hypothetical protein SEPCBS57363_004463 [Sporothrix epigloea]|uniref:Uncharacterized protein n=1 Tax=Sporothrix epigloea TaxID=1892477 RepID=A0ABP0DUB4_9PEZI